MLYRLYANKPMGGKATTIKAQKIFPGREIGCEKMLENESATNPIHKTKASTDNSGFVSVGWKVKILRMVALIESEGTVYLMRAGKVNNFDQIHFKKTVAAFADTGTTAPLLSLYSPACREWFFLENQRSSDQTWAMRTFLPSSRSVEVINDA